MFKNHKTRVASEVVSEPTNNTKKSKKVSSRDTSSEPVEYVDIATLNKLRGGETTQPAVSDKKVDKKNSQAVNTSSKSLPTSIPTSSIVNNVTKTSKKMLTLLAKAQLAGINEYSDSEASNQSVEGSEPSDVEDGSNRSDDGSEGSGSYSGSMSSGGSEEDPYAGLTDIQRSREMALDDQYNEDKDNKWCFIPSEEILPSDRAAPCLTHLL
jgi:hypothetical protein